MINKDKENIKPDITTESSDFSINADENAAGTTHLNDPIEDEPQIQKLKSELEEQKDKYVRLFAEFENFRRRTSREKIELSQTAGKEVIVSLLDILDDCDRAEEQLEKNEQNPEIQKGILLIFNKLRKTLQSKGLREMELLHTEFDPETEEAISQVKAPSEDLIGKVIAVVQKGYFLNDKIIRFAKVVVGK